MITTATRRGIPTFTSEESLVDPTFSLSLSFHPNKGASVLSSHPLQSPFLSPHPHHLSIRPFHVFGSDDSRLRYREIIDSTQIQPYTPFSESP
jgi:hypothetical protein